jgi:ADP-ribose pyrophosphatase YjhB (NUDIX family)
MKFCPECGSELQTRWQDREARTRAVCTVCNEVRYENPRVLVATVVSFQNRLLLCRRAEQPSIGRWNLPSGFLELGEALEMAAAREVAEETGVVISPNDLQLYAVTSLPKISEVYICFRVQASSGDCSVGPESLETAFFSEADAPWNDLAFAEMYGFLRLFFRELTSGEFGIHLSRVDDRGRHRREYRLVPPAD